MTLRRPRPTAMVLIALFLSGSVSAFSHRAAERHGYCSEDGELIHLPSDLPAEAPGDPTRSRVRPELEVRGEHACAALELLAQTSELAAAAVAPPAPRVTPTAQRAPARHSGRAIPILLLAPKVSPPR